jgi:hypothetical protein
MSDTASYPAGMFSQLPYGIKKTSYISFYKVQQYLKGNHSKSVLSGP